MSHYVTSNGADVVKASITFHRKENIPSLRSMLIQTLANYVKHHINTICFNCLLTVGEHWCFYDSDTL